MKKLNIRIYRKVNAPGGPSSDVNAVDRTLYIELGRFWEIRFSVHFRDHLMNYAVNVNVPEQRREFTKKIKDDGIIPFWYGFAYHDFDSDSAGYMPVPINLVYASWRWFKYNILRKIKFDWPRQLMYWEKRIYRLGQLDGYDAARFMGSLDDKGELTDREIAWQLILHKGKTTFGEVMDAKMEVLKNEREAQRRMLEGVDPHTNPGWNTLFRAK